MAVVTQTVIFRDGALVAQPAADFVLFEVLKASKEQKRQLEEESNIAEVILGYQDYPPELDTVFSAQPDPSHVRYKRLLRDPVIRPSSPAQPEAADALAGIIVRDFEGLKPFSDEEIRRTFDRMRKRR